VGLFVIGIGFIPYVLIAASGGCGSSWKQHQMEQ
jgi:hypothetical protein